MTSSVDVLIVGAGPAGLAAATAAARAGKRVTVLDDNPDAGGQIWRAGVHDAQRRPEKARLRALQEFRGSGAELLPGRQVVDVPKPGQLHAWLGATESLEVFEYDKLILATGARERFLPFPGWTLPGVFGAGGLQALARSGFEIRNKRVIVAGTGPLLLAVAAHLKEDGARVVAIAEQAGMLRLACFGSSLVRHPAKIPQAIRLKAALHDVPYHTACWPVQAQGTDHLTAVQLKTGDRSWTESCDLLACGFHLVPNTELASLLGCEIGDRGVIVGPDQRTSVPHVFCAGEPTGIAGLDSALVQGRVAGLAAAGELQQASRLYARRNAEAAIGQAMDRAFALRPELLALARPDTLICRCEDVHLRDLQAQTSDLSGWTDGKLQTRCGMGACQGRICGPAVSALFNWRNNSVRPPLFPIPLAALCCEEPQMQPGETIAK